MRPRPRYQLACIDCNEPHADETGHQPDAEGNDQKEAKRETVQRQSTQQDNQRCGTRNRATCDSQYEKLSRRYAIDRLARSLLHRGLSVVVAARPVTVRMRELGARISLKKKIETHSSDEDSREHSHQRGELFPQYVFLSVEGDRAQEIDSLGMRDSDDSAKEKSVSCCAPSSHQVGGDDGLAMAWLKRM